jgi:hypothetical protein
VRYGSKLRALHQSTDEVNLVVDTAAGLETITADYALLTLPFR